MLRLSEQNVTASVILVGIAMFMKQGCRSTDSPKYLVFIIKFLFEKGFV